MFSRITDLKFRITVCYTFSFCYFLKFIKDTNLFLYVFILSHRIKGRVKKFCKLHNETMIFEFNIAYWKSSKIMMSKAYQIHTTFISKIHNSNQNIVILTSGGQIPYIHWYWNSQIKCSWDNFLNQQNNKGSKHLKCRDNERSQIVTKY